MRVIIVDDHDLFRGGLVSLFNSQPDFEVIGEARTIRETLELVETTNPELILMDLGLPDGSGIDTVSQILEKRPDVNIVILTIHSSDERAFTAIRKGVRGFLLKNIPAPKLLSALRGLEQGELAVSRATLSRFIGEIMRFFNPGGDRPEASLTKREIEVLIELSTGDGNREIAERLSISENTVKVHVYNILRKLALNNRQEATHYARRHGLIKNTLEWRQNGIV